MGVSGYIHGGAFSSAGSICTGVVGRVAADSTYSAIGVRGEVSFEAESYSYGVYGLSQGSGIIKRDSIVPCPTPGCPVNFAGYFEGDVFTAGIYYYSDPKLKENIKEYKGGLEKLQKLNIKEYTYKNEEFPGMHMPQGLQVGVLSTELKKVFPNLVKRAIHPDLVNYTNDIEFESVNYDALIPVTIKATQEVNEKTEKLISEKKDLENKVEELENLISRMNEKLESLNKCVDELCSGSSFHNPGLPSGQNGAILYQSIPNPTSGSATINYNINTSFNSALITISTIDGRVVKEYTITHQGAGSIVFEKNDRSDNAYKYSLIVDGKVYDTKSIIITRN